MINSYKPHQSQESIQMAEEWCNSNVIIIPGGCTSIVQPMDKCINKPFKESMRQSWQCWMHEDPAKTKMGNLKQSTRQDAIKWVSKAWDSIKQETIVNAFLICGISNTPDCSEDDHVSDDHVSDDLPVVKLDSGAMSEESGEDEAEESNSDADELGDPFSDDSDTETNFSTLLHVCLYQLFCVDVTVFLCKHELWKCPNCVHSTCLKSFLGRAYSRD